MKKILIASSFILATIAIIVWFIMPKYQDLQNMKQKIEVKKIEIKTQEDYFSNLESIDEQMANFPTEIAKMDSAMPESMQVYSLVSFLQDRASANGLILKGIEFAAPIKSKENPDITSLNFTTEFSGSYPSFKKLIQDIGKSARLIEVQNISVAPLSVKDSQDSDFLVVLKTYSYKNNLNIAK